jgi:hypothetical protein
VCSQFVDFFCSILDFTVAMMTDIRFHTASYHALPLVSVLLFAFTSVVAFAQKEEQAPSQKVNVKTLTNKGNTTLTRLNQLNSPLNERNISLTPDGRFIFFLSDRGGQKWSRHPDTTERFDGDIWYSERVGGVWQEAKCLDSTVNTERGEDEPNISPDGHTVFFESWRPTWRDAGGPYWSAHLNGTSWENVRGIGGGINLFFSEMRKRTNEQFATDGAAFSPNGRTFIVACGNDYDGQMDLYWSRKAGKAGWLLCQKLAVSTDGNERSVFLAADGSTLYFASDGYGGFGGLDIFKATLNDDGSVTDITNIGEPFNTKADDYGFVVSAAGDEAYFSRNDDIYMAKLGNAQNALKPRPVAVLTGMVKDKVTGNAVQAKVKIRLTKDTDSIEEANSNALSGYYSSVLLPGKQYEQTVSAKGYKDFKRTFTAPSLQRSGIVEFDVVLQPAQ